MCTVTYIPGKDGFYLTSNRDEKIIRKQAVCPNTYEHGHAKLFYPKDPDAGGTWIAVNYNGNVAVLLNGAFIKHVSKPPYKKSRGIVLTELIAAESSLNTFSLIDLDNIEPFTIILFEGNDLFECRWDGKMKFSKKLENTLPQIWSSSTLYEDEVIKTREAWFKNWLLKNPAPNLHQVLNFHQFNGHGDTHNALLMNRENKMLTVSITGIYYKKNIADIQYIDLKDKTHTEYQIAFSTVESTVVK